MNTQISCSQSLQLILSVKSLLINQTQCFYFILFFFQKWNESPCGVDIKEIDHLDGRCCIRVHLADSGHHYSPIILHPSRPACWSKCVMKENKEVEDTLKQNLISRVAIFFLRHINSILSKVSLMTRKNGLQ